MGLERVLGIKSYINQCERNMNKALRKKLQSIERNKTATCGVIVKLFGCTAIHNKALFNIYHIYINKKTHIEKTTFTD